MNGQQPFNIDPLGILKKLGDGVDAVRSVISDIGGILAMDGKRSSRHLPNYFAGRRIRFRIPWTMPGELIVAAGATNINFPAATFQMTTDKPFEIHDVLLRASQSVAAAPFIPIAEPAPGIDKFWRLRMRDLSKNEEITNAAALVDSLVERDTHTWPWYQPYTIVRSEGFIVAVDSLLTAPNSLRAEIQFRGYLLVLESASETR